MGAGLKARELTAAYAFQAAFKSVRLINLVSTTLSSLKLPTVTNDGTDPPVIDQGAINHWHFNCYVVNACSEHTHTSQVMAVSVLQDIS